MQANCICKEHVVGPIVGLTWVWPCRVEVWAWCSTKMLLQRTCFGENILSLGVWFPYTGCVVSFHWVCAGQMHLQKTCFGAHSWFGLGLGMQGEGLGMVFKPNVSAKNMSRCEFPIIGCVVCLHWVCGFPTLGVWIPHTGCVASLPLMLWACGCWGVGVWAVGFAACFEIQSNPSKCNPIKSIE